LKDLLRRAAREPRQIAPAACRGRRR
jgi:hypothetical protein